MPGTGRPSFGVVGDNTIDRYVGAEDALYVGGNALNVAVQLAHAGEPVAAAMQAGATGAARTCGHLGAWEQRPRTPDRSP